MKTKMAEGGLSTSMAENKRATAGNGGTDSHDDSSDYSDSDDDGEPMPTGDMLMQIQMIS